MPLSVSKMATNTADVTFQYGDEDVHLTYYPSRITERVIAIASSFDTTTLDAVLSGLGSLNDILASLIKWWDVYEDDAQTMMYPIVAHDLEALPIMFRVACLQAIGSDSRPESIASQEKTLS